MRQFLFLALVAVGMTTTVFAQEGTVRKLTPAEQAQLDTDNQGRATQMTAAQWLARRSGGNQAERKAWEPTPPPERTYLSMDGTMCPLRDPWKRDGSAGKLQCRYGEAKLGIVFQTEQKDGLDTEVARRGAWEPWKT